MSSNCNSHPAETGRSTVYDPPQTLPQCKVLMYCSTHILDKERRFVKKEKSLLYSSIVGVIYQRKFPSSIIERPPMYLQVDEYKAVFSI